MVGELSRAHVASINKHHCLPTEMCSNEDASNEAEGRRLRSRVDGSLNSYSSHPVSTRGWFFEVHPVASASSALSSFIVSELDSASLLRGVIGYHPLLGV